MNAFEYMLLLTVVRLVLPVAGLLAIGEWLRRNERRSFHQFRS